MIILYYDIQGNPQKLENVDSIVMIKDFTIASVDYNNYSETIEIPVKSIYRIRPKTSFLDN